LNRRIAARPPALLDVHAPATVGTRAVKSIRRHNDDTHAQALALIDELLTVDGPELKAEPAPRTPRRECQPGPAGANPTGADAPTHSDRERATVCLIRARHTIT
ncbi:MAG: hypothetical protein ACRDPA_18215, partial [Solirubrobacteraceae bacterium]